MLRLELRRALEPRAPGPLLGRLVGVAERAQDLRGGKGKGRAVFVFVTIINNCQW